MVDSRNISFAISHFLQIVVAMLVYTGNILILIVTPRLKRVKSTSRYLILHLAVSDLLFAFSMSIRVVITLIGYKHNERIVCLTLMSFIIKSGGNSVTGILMLAVDVYASIKAGFNSTRFALSRKSTVLLIACCWIFWIIIGNASFVIKPDNIYKGRHSTIICMLGNEYYHRSFISSMIIGFLVIYFTTAFVLAMTVRLVKQASFKTYPSLKNTQLVHNKSHDIGTQPINNQVASGNFTNKTIPYRMMQRYRSMLKLAFFIVTAYGVCWLPLLFFGLKESILPSMDVDSVSSTQMFLSVPAFFHSVMNVCIYYYKSNEFKSAMKELCCQRSNVVQPFSQPQTVGNLAGTIETIA